MPLCSFEEGVGGLEWALQCVGREGNPDGPMRVPSSPDSNGFVTCVQTLIHEGCESSRSFALKMA